jgi:hypothetical protein
VTNRGLEAEAHLRVLAVFDLPQLAASLRIS